MSEKEDREVAVANFIRDAVIFSPPVAWGAMLGPPGFVVGAVATGILLIMDRNNDGKPNRPDPSDPA